MPERAAPAPTASPDTVLTVFRLAALFTFLAVAMGSVVCATESGAACPTWPGCYPDQVTPQWQVSPLVEFGHRLVAIASGPLVLAAAVSSLRVRGADRSVRLLPWVALAGAVAAGVFGRMVVVSGLPTWLGAVDLFSALTAMTVMAVAAVRLGKARSAAPSSGPRSSARPSTVMALATTSLVVLVATHVAGIFAAGVGSYTRCIGWPVWQLIDSDRYPGLQALRLVLAGVAVGLVVTTAVVTYRHPRWRAFGLVLAALFAGEMVLGLLIRVHELRSGWATAYSLCAVALLWTLGLLLGTASTQRSTSLVTPEPVSVSNPVG